jgi:hypothetical protein
MTTGRTDASPVAREILALAVSTVALLLLPCDQQEVEVVANDTFDLAEVQGVNLPARAIRTGANQNLASRSSLPT